MIVAAKLTIAVKVEDLSKKGKYSTCHYWKRTGKSQQPTHTYNRLLQSVSHYSFAEMISNLCANYLQCNKFDIQSCLEFQIKSIHSKCRRIPPVKLANLENLEQSSSGGGRHFGEFQVEK